MNHRYSLADIRARNRQTGGHFFDRKTMRFFGDTAASFKARHWGGRTFLERVRPGQSSDGLMTLPAGKLYEFDPIAGSIRGLDDRDAADARALALLTFKSLRQRLAAVGVTVSRRDGEFRVNLLGGTESTACYTDDIADALGSGLAMAAHHKIIGEIRNTA